MAPAGVRAALSGTLVFLAAFLASLISSILVAPFALAVPEFVVWPLAVGFGGLVAALVGAWVANGLAEGRTRSRLYAITGLSVAAALGVAMLVRLLGSTAIGDLFSNVFSRLVLTSAVLGLVVNALVWRFRTPSARLRSELSATFGLLALGILAILLSVTITCSITDCTP